MGFQKDSYNAIERLKIECRKTKTKVITLPNHSKRKQRQSDHGDHGENIFEAVTNLNGREQSASLISQLMAANDKQKPKRTRTNLTLNRKPF